DIAELLIRPVGRPGHKPVVWYKGFLYRAASWTTARRVVAKIEHHAGELFPRLGFIVTNTQLANRKVVHFYNQRGKAEQWIKEGKQAVKMTRLSCHRFRSNEVRLWLSILAYNLGNLWRRLTLPAGIEDWSLTSLQQRVVKTSGRLVKHARYYWLMLAEGHLTRTRFSAMLCRIPLVPIPANRSAGGVQQNADDRKGDEGEVSKKMATRCFYEAGWTKRAAHLPVFRHKRW